VGRIVAIVWVLAGCGRIAFEAMPDGALAGGPRAVTIAYPTQNIFALVDVTNVMLAPVAHGGRLVFGIAPALPPGLAFDTTTGAISGVPSQVVDDLPVVVTASSALGSASVTLAITALPGYRVDTTLDGGDDDAGTDATCHSAQANGCSLRAAIETANRRAGAQLVLLDATAYTIDNASLEAIQNDVVVAGVGASQTLVEPSAMHGYGLFTLATAHRLELAGITFRGFGAVDGPIVHQDAGVLAASECAFENNSSLGRGGVLFVDNGASSVLERCTFTANMSFGGNGWGGVIDGEGANTSIRVSASYATQNLTNWGSFAHITTGTTLALENSTLTGNTSQISGTLASPGGTYTLVNDTIVSNTNTYATPDDSTQSSAGIYLYAAPAHYTLANTLLAYNALFDGTERNCNRRDLTTSLTSSGGNVFSDGGNNCAMYFSTDDRFGATPGIDPSGATLHGGLTPTVLLAPSSIAIDTGMTAPCPAIDQRGLARPIGAGCDVGAVEMP
jgi:CSLREA domain-containing protein